MSQYFKTEKVEYRGVIIRPMTKNFNEWLHDFRSTYERLGYTIDYTKEPAYGEYLNYWRTDKWFLFFDNGRVVEVPHMKCSETLDMFYARVDKKIEKVVKESTTDLGQFACLMQALLTEKLGGVHLSCYPTTYGIGVWYFYNWDFVKQKAHIDAVLDSLGVEYTNEYSDAMYVYRYRISKKEANRILIANNLR